MQIFKAYSIVSLVLFFSTFAISAHAYYGGGPACEAVCRVNWHFCENSCNNDSSVSTGETCEERCLWGNSTCLTGCETSAGQCRETCRSHIRTESGVYLTIPHPKCMRSCSAINSSCRSSCTGGSSDCLLACDINAPNCGIHCGQAYGACLESCRRRPPCLSHFDCAPDEGCWQGRCLQQ